MEFIDIENWKRKDHYKFFKAFDYPQFSLCSNLDITKYYRYIKEKNLPFFISVLYAATKAANSIPEFRLRIREDKVLLHEVVNPSFTVLNDEDVFSFCPVEFIDEFDAFKTTALNAIDKIKKNVTMEDEPGRDDLLFVTSIPWVSFTNITHPIHMHPVDCIPRIAWGKFFEENGKTKLPLSIQAHHALVDGIHVGRFFNELQDILDNPEKHLH